MTRSPLRVVFAGTPDFAAQHLAALLNEHYQVVGVLTQPDRPAGRGKHLQPSAVKKLALAHDLPIYQPTTLKTAEARAPLAQWQPDIMIVVAYGLILPQAVLDIPSYGCLNVHGSLLPRWRGAAPIQRAIEAGDSESGVTIMQMDAGLDTGAMLYQLACPILATDTSADLYEKLATLGPQALAHVLQQLTEHGELKGEPQDDALATYAHKLSKADAQIDWTQPAEVLARKLHAYTPWPGLQTTSADQVVKIHQATALPQSASAQPGVIEHADHDGICVATGDGLIRLEKLQLPGKKPLPAQDILNGRKAQFAPGQRLGAADE